MKRETENTEGNRDRKRDKDGWRAERKTARKAKDVARGAYAGKRTERAKSF